MAEVSNIVKLADLETVLLPMAVSEISSDFLVPNLEPYIKELFSLLKIPEYANKVICKSNYSFTYSNNRTYYVVSIDFPFEFKKEYCGCLKRGFIVFTNDDSTLYYFGEVLAEDFNKGLFLKLCYYFLSGKDIASYDVMESTVENDKVMAEQLPIFVYGIKYYGVAGTIVKSPIDIVNKKEEVKKGYINPLLF